MKSHSQTPISIYLVEDDSLVRAGLRALLEQDPTFEVVGEQGDARTAIEEVGTLRPDIILLDITLPGLSGIDAIGPLKEISPRTRILMASHHHGSQMVRQSLRAGADGYLAKDSKPEELQLAIESIHQGETFVSPKVAGVLVERLCSESPDAGTPLGALTDREREVFQLLAIGKSNKDVAVLLHVSVSTVKKHRESLQRKLGCHSAAEMARIAIREGLLGL